MGPAKWTQRYKKTIEIENLALKPAAESNLSKPAASVIVSLFKAEKHLMSLLSNLRKQENFQDIEFIFVDVQGSEWVRERLLEFARENRWTQIIRHEHRSGIYEAWNSAIRKSRSSYVTNWNADDLRSENCLTEQMLTLETLKNVGVVYTNFYLSLHPDATWKQLEEINAASNLNHVTLRSMLISEATPHCAPMWRKSLHEQFGYFNESYKIAGDREFWIRILDRGVRFHLDPRIMTGYYLNPEGLSTAKGEAGKEAKRLALEAKELKRGLGRSNPRKSLLNLISELEEVRVESRN